MKKKLSLVLLLLFILSYNEGFIHARTFCFVDLLYSLSSSNSNYEENSTDISLTIVTDLSSPIKFVYDKSGNRITKTLTIASKSRLSNEIPEEIIREEIDTRKIDIYSSIAGQITVEISTLEGMKNGIIQIYSFPYGIMLLNRHIKNNREDLDLNSYPSGIYILLITIDGKKTSYKLMK